MATINAIQDAINRVKKLRSNAERARNKQVVAETNKMEDQLKKQLVVAKLEEKNLKLKQQVAAANRRIDAARSKQRQMKYGNTVKTIKQISKMGKNLGKRLGL
jgi:predicted  nucleic acid-binding Zn-ribbon protein